MVKEMSTALTYSKSGPSPPQSDKEKKYYDFVRKWSAIVAKRSTTIQAVRNYLAQRGIPRIDQIDAIQRITSIDINAKLTDGYKKWFEDGALIAISTERSNIFLTLRNHLELQCSIGFYEEDACLNLIGAFYINEDFLYSCRWPGPFYETLVNVITAKPFFQAEGKITAEIKHKFGVETLRVICIKFEDAMRYPLSRSDFANAILNFSRAFASFNKKLNSSEIKSILANVKTLYNTPNGLFIDRLISLIYTGKDIEGGKQPIWKQELFPLTEAEINQYLLVVPKIVTSLSLQY